MIKEFQGQYRWLSNFELVDIKHEEIIYPSVEHAYQSAKSSNPEWKLICCAIDKTPGQIKRLSRTVKLLPAWNVMKKGVMYDCLKQKFRQEPYSYWLINTGDQNIQEGNIWGDEFWGVCQKTGKGENHLGRMIMDIRKSISEKLYCCVCGTDITNIGRRLFCEECNRPIKLKS